MDFAINGRNGRVLLSRFYFAPRRASVSITLGCLTLFMTVFMATRPALAWNTPSHAITGAIAYQELKATDPQTLAKVVAILKRHPDYATIWLPKIEEAKARGVDPDEMLLMLAARWPDDARSKLRGREPWHYVNFPYAPASRSSTIGPEATTPNILTAYKENVSLLQAPLTGTGAVSGSPSAQDDIGHAEALCWIMHLIGDIHQPLHTTAYFKDPQFSGKKGDAGGNLFYVKAEEGRATINLHSLWDGSITASQNPREWEQSAILLRASHKRDTLPELKTVSFDAWAKESFAIAGSTAYQGGTLQSGPNKAEGAVLPAGYLVAMKTAAETRMSLAGYRLADSLHTLLKDIRTPDPDSLPIDTTPKPKPGTPLDAEPPGGSATATEGQVWVNTKSGVYWKPGTRYYGKTKEGRYMNEADAMKAGYHAARGQ